MPVTCEPDEPVSWPNMRLLADQLDDLAQWLGATTHESLLDAVGTPFGLKRTVSLADLAGGPDMYVKFELDASDPESPPVVTKTILVDAAFQPYDLGVSAFDVAHRANILEELANETPSELYFRWEGDGCFCESMFSVASVAGGYTLYKTDVPDVDPHHDCAYSLKVPQPGDLLDSSQYFFNHLFFPKFNRQKGNEEIQTFVMCDGGQEDGLILEYDNDRTLIAAYRKCIAGRFVWAIRRKWFDKIWQTLFNLFDCANNGGTQGSLYAPGRNYSYQAYLGYGDYRVRPSIGADITSINFDSASLDSTRVLRHVEYAEHFREILSAAYSETPTYRYSPATGAYFVPPHTFSEVEGKGCVIDYSSKRGPAQPWRVGLPEASGTFGHSEIVSVFPFLNNYDACQADACEFATQKTRHYCRTLKEIENIIEATRWVLLPRINAPGCGACGLEADIPFHTAPGVLDNGYEYSEYIYSIGSEVRDIDSISLSGRFPSAACRALINNYVKPFWPFVYFVQAYAEYKPGVYDLPVACIPKPEITLNVGSVGWSPPESPDAVQLTGGRFISSLVNNPDNGSAFALVGTSGTLGAGIDWKYEDEDIACTELELDESFFKFIVLVRVSKGAFRTLNISDSPAYNG